MGAFSLIVVINLLNRLFSRLLSRRRCFENAMGEAEGVQATAQKILQVCLDKKIKVLAFDFDLTIVNVHTQGAWIGTIDQLASCVNPWAKVLIRETLARNDVSMCVVTFSSQPRTIRDVLLNCFPEFESKITRMAICANTGLQCVPYFTNSDDMKGKNCHLKLAIDHISADEPNLGTILSKNVLLIDDDGNNVKTANAQGYRGCIVTDRYNMKKFLSDVKKIRDSSL